MRDHEWRVMDLNFKLVSATNIIYMVHPQSTLPLPTLKNDAGTVHEVTTIDYIIVYIL